MRYQTEVFLFLFFFSVCLLSALFFIRTFDYHQNNKAAGDTDQYGVKYQ